MNPLSLFLASGLSFFAGAVLIAAAFGALPYWKSKLSGPAIRLVSLVGLVLMIFSATPLPMVYYVLLVAAVTFGLVAPSLKTRDPQRRFHINVASRALPAIVCVAGILWEAPYHLRPRIGDEKYPRLYVIGDSISSGLENGEVIWPHLIREQKSIDIVNHASAGETLGTALPKIKNIPDERALVLLEIGGNDMLSPVPVKEFEADLDTLLAQRAKSDLKLVMMELPLPPFFNNYGRAQRRLARRHKVTLIPKRNFAHALSGADATVDGLHLSPGGAQAMADVVWDFLGESIER